MSRNIGSESCDFCGADPICEEDPRPLTEAEGGPYTDAMRRVLFMNAICPKCGALYLAWAGRSHSEPVPLGRQFFDLSFRHSFNDEPAIEDHPIWRVDQFGDRVGLIEDPERMSYWRSHWTSPRNEKEAEYQRRDLRQQIAWTARREAARAQTQEPTREESQP